MKRKIALVLLHDSRKKILLQHRDNSAKVLPDFWGFFGGNIEKGETPLEAIKREIKEELNYSLKNPNFMKKQDFKYPGFEGTMYIFIEKYDSVQKLVLNEGKDMGWFSVSQAKKLKLADPGGKILDYAKGKY